MGKRGGRRRRKKEASATPEAKNAPSQPSLEVFIEEGPSDNTEDSKAASSSRSTVTALPLSSSSLLQQATANPSLQRVKDCWSRVSQRKGKKVLSPTPIQWQSWSFLLPEIASAETTTDSETAASPPTEHPRSLLALAPTGCGKTLAYGIPLVLRATLEQTGMNECNIYGLVLVHTREQASQVRREIRFGLTHKSNVRVVSIHGGVDKQNQRQELLQSSGRKGENIIVVATPGRLVDLLSDDNELSRAFSNINFVVLDEADHLAANSDLAQQVDDILLHLPSDLERTICLFSATVPERIRAQWAKWVPGRRVCIKVNTVVVGGKNDASKNSEKGTESAEGVAEIAGNNSSDDGGKKRSHAGGPLDLAQIPAHITQTLHVCSAHKKPRKLLTTLSKIHAQEANQRTKSLCLVFFAKIKTLQYVHKLLIKEGVKCAEYHSQMGSQSARETTLHNFRSGKIPTLLATDIAARGIHCNNIEHVINYDFPGTLEQYIHRCGRAGRNHQSADTPEKTGHRAATVYSFFTRNLAPMAPDVVSLLRTCNAWVDPNLVALVIEGGSPRNEGESSARNEGESSARKRRKHTKEQGGDVRNETQQRSESKSNDDSIDSDDDGQFRFLNPKRITLKRALHVSDASDASDDDESGST